MRVTEAGVVLIRKFEGLRMDAYQDEGGKWTIGYGHTVSVYPGMHITPTIADNMLRLDLIVFGTGVKSLLVGITTTDPQYSAMLSLAYNIGVHAFSTSSVLKLHVAGNYKRAGTSFKLWNKVTVNGKETVSRGLIARRAAERELYLT